MSTKNHPGQFRCFEAALPDEPMFVILGRDPAGPATVEFWAQERVKQEKVHERDDQDRIKAAIDEAKDMADWRSRMVAHAEEMGEPPVWKLPRPFGDDLSPVREAPVTRPSFDYYPDPDGDPVKVTPLSYTRMSELLDYATGYGEFDETTPSGTEASEPNIAGEPMNDMRRATIWTLKRCMGIVPENQMPPVADDGPRPEVKLLIHAEGLFKVPGIDAPQTMEQIAAVYRKAAKSVDKSPTLDSAPEDLAHAPEVPHHRFSVFHEAGDYAYARGLEVNPMHLATALDAMAKSGWHLCAIFGQTDAQHIGFIFRREVERFSAFEIAHGFGGGFETATRRSDKPVEWPDDFKGTDDLDMGRGQQP